MIGFIGVVLVSHSQLSTYLEGMVNTKVQAQDKCTLKRCCGGFLKGAVVTVISVLSGSARVSDGSKESYVSTALLKKQGE